MSDIKIETEEMFKKFINTEYRKLMPLGEINLIHEVIFFCISEKQSRIATLESGFKKLLEASEFYDNEINNFYDLLHNKAREALNSEEVKAVIKLLNEKE